MCGIAGFFSSDPVSFDSRSVAIDMLKGIEHRGPDERGIVFGSNVGLANSRLKIIDLHTGAQPMVSDERYWIVYNGEVYNFREIREELIELGNKFESTSDTEVVLKAWIQWGESCIERFNGGFSFAIFDSKINEVFLVRDRFGKRPLFYAVVNNTLIFSSEMKSFIKFPNFQFRWNPVEVQKIFTFWTPMFGATAFEGVNQLLPGHLLNFKNSNINIRKYCNPLFTESEGDKPIEEIIGDLKEEINRSIDLRIRSDVEIGVALSGGLDSVVVSKLVADRLGKSVKTFSVSFEDSEFDESKYQNIMSRKIASDHFQVRISSSDLAENFREAIWFGEQPVFRTAFVPMFLLSKLVSDAGIKVVLSGEGADEIFLGYNIFKEAVLRESWGHLSEKSKLSALTELYPYIKHFNQANSAALIGLFNRFSGGLKTPLFSHLMRIHNSNLSSRLIRGKINLEDSLVEEAKRNFGFDDGWSILKKAQFWEINGLLGGYLLSTQGDRMSFANGVESRCPFLDKDLFSYLQKIPPTIKMQAGKGEKWLLKECFKEGIPNEILNRPKQPYRAPDISLFFGDKENLIDQCQWESFFKECEFIDNNLCKKLIEKVVKTCGKGLSQAEVQAMIFLLSIYMLNRLFVNGEGVQFLKSECYLDFERKI